MAMSPLQTQDASGEVQADDVEVIQRRVYRSLPAFRGAAEVAMVLVLREGHSNLTMRPEIMFSFL